jgi:hypothetical protein
MANSGPIHMPRSAATAELPAPTGDVPDHPYHGSGQWPIPVISAGQRITGVPLYGPSITSLVP